MKYCIRCGKVGDPKSITKGSFGLELALWLLFLVPGVIYSIWRLASRYAGCPWCGSPDLVPLDSPVARTALERRT